MKNGCASSSSSTCGSQRGDRVGQRRQRIAPQGGGERRVGGGRVAREQRLQAPAGARHDRRRPAGVRAREPLDEIGPDERQVARADEDLARHPALPPAAPAPSSAWTIPASGWRGSAGSIQIGTPGSGGSALLLLRDHDDLREDRLQRPQRIAHERHAVQLDDRLASADAAPDATREHDADRIPCVAHRSVGA